MVSTQIPNRFKARVVASIGSLILYVICGDENFKYLLEYNNEILMDSKLTTVQKVPASRK
jgi:hypothetical protein